MSTGAVTPQMLLDPSQFPYAGFNGHGGTSGLQGQFLNESDQFIKQEDSLLQQPQGLESFLSGPPNDSPLYHALLSQGNQSINSSYDNAIEGVRSSAASRGFGYADPTEQGSEAGLRGQEAGALSQEPGIALNETIAPELQAAGLETQQAGLLANQSTANIGDVTALQAARLGKTASITNSISQIIGDAEKAAGEAAAGAGK